MKIIFDIITFLCIISLQNKMSVNSCNNRPCSTSFAGCYEGSLTYKYILILILLLQYADRTWPLIILGIIMFLPGAYHVRIAYYAYRQYPGYSFDDIPEFD